MRRLGRHAALVASATGAMLVALDGTVLLVAQPSLRHDLHADVAAVQWTGTGYLLAVAALLVVAGRMGDRYGHRRLLVAGVLGFAAASAGIVFAPTIGWVVGLRVVQGVFGALLQPATLALLRLAYPADRLSAAVAVRTSAIGVAAASGPVVGGALVAHLGWRGVFVLNVPVALVVAAVTAAVRIPARDRAAAAQRLDLTSAVLVAAALAAGVYTLVGVPANGWTDAPTLAGLALTATVTVLLVMRQRRVVCPIVPPVVARSVAVTGGVTMLLVTAGGVFGALFVATFYLQDVIRLDPLAAGLRVLPLTVLMVVGAPVVHLLLRRYGPRRTGVAGSGLVVLAILGMSRLSPASTGVTTGAVLAVLGAGFAAVMVTATSTVVGEAPAGYAGVVGGLKQTAMNVGPALGIAVAAGAMMAARPAVPVPAADTPPVRATGPALLVLAALAALGLLVALRLPRRPPPNADLVPVGDRTNERGGLGRPSTLPPAHRPDPQR